MEIHNNVPRDEVGVLVQQCMSEGAVIVVVTQNSGDRTCTVSVQRKQSPYRPRRFGQSEARVL